MLLKDCTQYASKFGKISCGHRTGKVQFSFQCSNYHTIALISHASKVILKILQGRLQQDVNWGLPDVQAGLRKGRGTRDQIANICWIMEKAREFQKTSASLTMLKPLTLWITTNCGKFFKAWEYQTTLPASWEICMQVKKQQNRHETTDWFQIGKGVHQDYVLSPCLFNAYAEYIMWNARTGPLTNWNQDCLGEIAITSDMQMIQF